LQHPGVCADRRSYFPPTNTVNRARRAPRVPTKRMRPGERKRRRLIFKALPKRQQEQQMCDYSLHQRASRPARVGDRLVSTAFTNSVTRGFSDTATSNVAVCLVTRLRPGQHAMVLQLPVTADMKRVAPIETAPPPVARAVR
jgi:hypothetical protein